MRIQRSVIILGLLLGQLTWARGTLNYVKNLRSTSASSRMAGVDSLIDSFTVGCRLGPWTQAALARSQTLTSTLQGLLKKAECQGIEESINAASGIENNLAVLVKNNDLTSEFLLREQLRELALATQDPGLDEGAKAQIVKTYGDTQVKLAELQQKIRIQSTSTFDSNLQLASSHLRKNLGILVSESSHLSECYSQNPSAAFQIAASIGEVAGTFLPDVAGIASSGVSKLLQVGVEAARTMPMAEAITDTYAARMPIALTCGLEVLARDYCHARDARALVDFSGSVSSEPNAFFRGVDFVENSLPILNAWLFEVQNGGKAVDRVQAVRVSRQFGRVNQANRQRRKVEAIISETRIDMQNAKNDDDRAQYVKGMISKIFAVFFRAREDTLFVGQTALGLLQKIVGDQVQLDPAQNEFDEYVSYAYQPHWTVDLFESRLFDPKDGLFTKAQAEVFRIFRERVNVDPPQLIRAATARRAQGVSPLGALYQLVRFLDQYAQDSRSDFAAQEGEFLRSFRERLIKVIKALENPEATQPVNENAVNSETVYTQIYDLFELQNSNTYLQGRISRLVTDDLANRLCRGEGPQNVREVIAIAGRDISSLIQESVSRYEVRTDLDSAQGLMSTTLSEFRDFFSLNLRWAIEDKIQLAKDNRETGDGPSPNRAVAAKLCLLTLMTGMEWPRDIDIRWCQGLQIQSDDARQTLSFDDLRVKLQGRPFEDRVCVYEDFLRRDRLRVLLQRQQNSSEVCQRP